MNCKHDIPLDKACAACRRPATPVSASLSYDETHEFIYGESIGIPRRWGALGPVDRAAWDIISMFRGRKGFQWWWDAHDFDAESRNEIYAELKAIISKIDL